MFGSVLPPLVILMVHLIDGLVYVLYDDIYVYKYILHEYYDQRDSLWFKWYYLFSIISVAELNNSRSNQMKCLHMYRMMILHYYHYYHHDHWPF